MTCPKSIKLPDCLQRSLPVPFTVPESPPCHPLNVHFCFKINYCDSPLLIIPWIAPTDFLLARISRPRCATLNKYILLYSYVLFLQRGVGFCLSISLPLSSPSVCQWVLCGIQLPSSITSIHADATLPPSLLWQWICFYYTEEHSNRLDHSLPPTPPVAGNGWQ